MNSKLKALKIPYDQLNSETLNGVIEEFVTRDGTDYREFEVSLKIKITGNAKKNRIVPKRKLISRRLRRGDSFALPNRMC